MVGLSNTDAKARGKWALADFHTVCLSFCRCLATLHSVGIQKFGKDAVQV